MARSPRRSSARRRKRRGALPAGMALSEQVQCAARMPTTARRVTMMGNYYATLWPDAKAVIHDAAANFSTIQKRTESFRKTFYDSTLPYWMLDCITSQAATIRHIGVVFQIANGEPYGWEGSNGCCQPTCTHVWGYEQTLAHLFPDLERGMRRLDFKCQQDPDGGVHNRMVCPTPGHPTSEHPFVDGHSSCILKAYREALNSPRRFVLQAVLAAREAGGRVSHRPRRRRRPARRRARRRAVEHLRRSLARRNHVHVGLLSRRPPRRRGVGEADGRHQDRRTLPRHLPQGPGESRQSLLERRILPTGLAQLHEHGRRSRARLHVRPTHRPVVGASARPRLHPAQGKGANRPALDLQVQLAARHHRLPPIAARVLPPTATREC